MLAALRANAVTVWIFLSNSEKSSKGPGQPGRNATHLRRATATHRPQHGEASAKRHHHAPLKARHRNAGHPDQPQNRPPHRRNNPLRPSTQRCRTHLKMGIILQSASDFLVFTGVLPTFSLHWCALVPISICKVSTKLYELLVGVGILVFAPRKYPFLFLR